MGLFDFFKNKKTPDDHSNGQQPANDLFNSLKKYHEHIVYFMGLQMRGNYAPISAYEKTNGEIVGFLYIMGDHAPYSLSVEQVLTRMEDRFKRQLANNEIRSYSILYHSQFNNDLNHAIANSDEELKAISVKYAFKDGKDGVIGLPYVFEGEEVTYKGFSRFTPEENNIIFNTQTQSDKNYFEEREEITAPESENEIGIKIKKINTKSLNDTWCGIFGFDSFRSPDGGQALKECFALAATKEPVYKNANLSISEIEFPPVKFKTVIQNNQPKTILPEITTSYTLDFETKDIEEWENINDLEAIVSGRARDTFGLWYFATDYAKNRSRYLTEKKLNVHISGIVFVLDIHTHDDTDSEVKYSENFTMYMPNNDLPNYGCFDFIGELESFKEVSLLNDKSLQGYIMKVRLITNEEVKDFFTIDMYVAKENMRFTELQQGMKLTGMFQMQGRIAD